MKPEELAAKIEEWEKVLAEVNEAITWAQSPGWSHAECRKKIDEMRALIPDVDKEEELIDAEFADPLSQRVDAPNRRATIAQMLESRQKEKAKKMGKGSHKKGDKKANAHKKAKGGKTAGGKKRVGAK